MAQRKITAKQQEFLDYIKEEILKKGTIQVYEDQKTNRNMNAYGHGAQRSIQIALIQQLAEIQRLRKERKNAGQQVRGELS